LFLGEAVTGQKLQYKSGNFQIMAAGNLRSGGLSNLAALASPDQPPKGSWILLWKIRNWKTLRRTT
jgi:hypothetical protein